MFVFPAGSRGLFAASKVLLCLIYDTCLGFWIHFPFTMVSFIADALVSERKEQFLL